MSDVILNLLPLTHEERAAFLALAPDARHLFHPDEVPSEETVPVGDEEVAAATVVLGCLPPARLPMAQNLRWLQTYSAGVNPYLEPGVFPAGAALTSAVGCYGPAVAEHLLTLCLSVCKRIPHYCKQQENRVFEPYRTSESLAGSAKSLWGANVLVLGTGDLGANFAKLCKAFGAHTVGLKRTVTGPVDGFDEVAPITELDSRLPQADVVCLMLPHSPETVHIMNEGPIRAMKRDAILLNGGRGSAIDPQGLCAALTDGHLWGAALDVTEPEPLPENHPLWSAPRLLITPHVAGGMTRLEVTRKAIVALCQENLRAYLAGEPLKNRCR